MLNASRSNDAALNEKRKWKTTSLLYSLENHASRQKSDERGAEGDQVRRRSVGNNSCRAGRWDGGAVSAADGSVSASRSRS